jgi:D-aminopeptidase
VGGYYFAPTLFGRVTDYDLVLYVAIHAASGTPGAFFPHTHSGVFSRLLLQVEYYSGMSDFFFYQIVRNQLGN